MTLYDFPVVQIFEVKTNQNVWENLITFNETYLSGMAMSNDMVMNHLKAPSMTRVLA